MELLVRLGNFFEQARSDADYATFANELRVGIRSPTTSILFPPAI